MAICASCYATIGFSLPATNKDCNEDGYFAKRIHKKFRRLSFALTEEAKKVSEIWYAVKSRQVSNTLGRPEGSIPDLSIKAIPKSKGETKG